MGDSLVADVNGALQAGLAGGLWWKAAHWIRTAHSLLAGVSKCCRGQGLGIRAVPAIKRLDPTRGISQAGAIPSAAPLGLRGQPTAAAAHPRAGAVWVNRGGLRPLPTGLRPAAILSSVLELPSALEQLRLLPPAAPLHQPATAEEDQPRQDDTPVAVAV